MRRWFYPACLAVLWPLNQLLARLMVNRVVPGSVLHVSYMGHIPYQSVRTLREHGVAADYLAVGHSRVWSLSDFQIAGTAVLLSHRDGRQPRPSPFTQPPAQSG